MRRNRIEAEVAERDNKRGERENYRDAVVGGSD